MEFKIVHKRIGSDIWANTRLRIIRKLIISDNNKILDLGCGTGYVGLNLQNSDVVFADIEPKYLEQIKGNCVVLDARKLPFKKEVFDIVICADVMEHIKEDELALREIYRVLKKNGNALVAVPAYRGLYGHHDELIGHYRRYNKKDFVKLAEKTGFKIKYSRYACSFLFFPFLINQLFVKSNKAYTGKSKLERRLLPLLNIAAWTESNIKLPFGLNLLFMLEK